MKKIVITFMILLCLPLFAGQKTNAKSISERLSPGMEIIERSIRLNKGNVCGGAISFSKEDFIGISREMKGESVTIKTLPDPTVASLRLYGVAIREGQIVSYEDLEEFLAIPCTTEKGETEFTFQIGASEPSYQCSLLFSGHQSLKPIGRDLKMETYQNIPFSGEVEVIDHNCEVQFEITKMCHHGIINFDRKSGDFTYSPERNFIGKDKLQYCAVDEYGNKSDPCTVWIQVNEAKQNLYFCDMIENPAHKEAVRACETGILSYYHNEDELPVFEPNRLLTKNEFISATSTTLKRYGRIGFNIEVMAQENAADHPVSLTESLELLQSIINGLESEKKEALQKAVSELKEYLHNEGQGACTRENCLKILTMLENALKL